jgi:hypothetical protein
MVAKMPFFFLFQSVFFVHAVVFVGSLFPHHQPNTIEGATEYTEECKKNIIVVFLRGGTRNKNKMCMCACVRVYFSGML